MSDEGSRSEDRSQSPRKTEPLLRARGLQKQYTTTDGFLDRLLGGGKTVTAVDSVDLDIYEGETLGLVGESGCGKTTLARSLLCLDEPTSGSIQYRGTELTDCTGRQLRELRSDVQYVFQNATASLNPRLTIADIVGEALAVHDVVPPDRRGDRIRELLETVGLQPSYANRYPHECSAGQRQRIGLARALAVEPELIVCDEPVSALDVSVQAQLLNLLVDLQEQFGLSYLLIAHDLSVVEHVADRIAVMYLGELVEVGSTEAVFGDPSHPYTEALLSAIPEPDPCWEGDRIILDGPVPSSIDPPSGCRFHTRCHRVVPPDEYEFADGVFETLLQLRRRLTTAETIDDLHTTSASDDQTTAIRAAYDLPDELADPAADRVLSTALSHLETGALGETEAVLDDAFRSPCEDRTPELQAGPDHHRISCLRFEQSVDDQADADSDRTSDAHRDDADRTGDAHRDNTDRTGDHDRTAPN